MAESNKGRDEKDGTGLDVVFSKLMVDKSWNGASQCDNVSKATGSESLFKGKMKRSPMRDKDSESRMHSKRIRPYETEDLPFGENLEHLSFQEEECKDSKCTCNRQHRSRQRTEDVLNFAKAWKSPLTSPERKIVKDSRFKLHHKEKDHKVVLRAARLKLHRLQWYKGPLLKKGNLNKDGVFGEGNSQTDFGVLAKKSESWSGNSGIQKHSELFQNPTFTQPQATRPKMPTRYNSASSSSSATSFWPPANANPSAIKSTESSTCDSASITPSMQSPASLYRTREAPGETGATVSRDRTGVPRQSSPTASSCPLHPGKCTRPCSCAEQARMDATDYSVDELASYLDEFVYIPKKMSDMAEMMYT